MYSYKDKYLKYKQKYINLKKYCQKGGEKDFYDFDKYYIDDNNKYLSEYFLDNKVSKESIQKIKNDFQILYRRYYERLTNTSCDGILIPLYLDIFTHSDECSNKESQYRVDYIEQAKSYNFMYKSKLDIIEKLDEKFNTDIQILISQLKELNKFNFIHKDINIDDLIKSLSKDKLIKEYGFLFERKMIKNIIEEFNEKKYFDKILETESKIKIEETTIINILNEIFLNGKFKLGDDKFLIIKNKDDKLDFYGYKYAVNHDYVNNTILYLILKVYNTYIHQDITVNIHITTIKGLMFLYENIQKLDFRLIDSDSNEIEGDIKNILQEVSIEFNKISEKINQLKIIDNICTDNENKFKINLINIYSKIDEIDDYIILFRFRSYSISLDFNNIKNIVETDIKDTLKRKKEEYKKYIKESFIENNDVNDKIIEIDLEFIKKRYYFKKLEYISELHANIVILSKIYIDDEMYILCRRIEPHRHSVNYCRNSVRKEIRDIFTHIFGNKLIYIDFYTTSHYGLQMNECIDIHRKYITNLFDNIKDITVCKESQLNYLDGFCASWCAYIATVIIFNKNKKVSEIDEYFETYNLPIKSFVDTHNEEYDKLDKTNEELINEFRSYISLFYENDDLKISPMGFEYNEVKNLKLYTFILIYYAYISKNVIFINSLISKNDKQKINKFLTKFNFEEFNKKIDENIKYKLELDVDADYKYAKYLSDINLRHYCEDNIFDHNDFCRCYIQCKKVPDIHKDMCNESVYCLEPLNNNLLDKEQIALNKYILFEKKVFPERES